MRQALLHLLRHGQTQGGGRPRYLGQTDAPLDAVGITQAQAWSRFWGPGRFSQVYCSDLARARQTARLIAGEQAEVQALVGLRELNLGQWDGLAMEEVKASQPAAYAARGRDLEGFCVPGGESFADLRERVLPEFARICAEAQGDVLVVAHAGVNRVILCQVLGMPLARLFRLSQEHAALNLLEVRGQEITLRLLNMTLEQAGWGDH